MSYTVRWVNSALADLTQLWLDAQDRASITAAVHAIDEALSRDPLNCGESREEDRRIFFVAPLAITFRVDSDRRQVIVLDVWRTDRRP